MRAARPSPRAALLVQALTAEGQRAELAWQAWQRDVDDVSALLAADQAEVVRSLLPLLQARIESGVLQAPKLLRTFARAASVRESLRADTYVSIFVATFDALHEGQNLALVSGLALAAECYGGLQLRHSGPIEFVVAPEHIARTVSSLEAAGCERLQTPTAARTTRQWMLHESGLTMGVSSQIAAHPYHRVALGEWETSFERVSIGGRELFQPKPHLALFETLLRGAYASEATSLTWAIDAALLVRARPDLDWEAFLVVVEAAFASLALRESLEWLASDAAVPVPASVIEALGEQCASLPAAAKDFALSAAWLALGANPGAFLRACQGPGDLWTCARWALAPHPSALRWIADAPTRSALAAAYLTRPLGWLRGAGSVGTGLALATQLLLNHAA